MTSTAPSTKQLESSTPSETAIRWPTTELLLRRRSTESTRLIGLIKLCSAAQPALRTISGRAPLGNKGSDPSVWTAELWFGPARLRSVRLEPQHSSRGHRRRRELRLVLRPGPRLLP